MKIRININSELWERFRSKVNHDNLVLDEVVPQVFEKAIRDYLEPPTVIEKIAAMSDEQKQDFVHTFNTADLPIIDRITPPKPPPTTAPTKRCELCDLPTERTFLSEGRRVCYACWKKAITEPTPRAS